jgi:hypothetical protein
MRSEAPVTSGRSPTTITPRQAVEQVHALLQARQPRTGLAALAGVDVAVAEPEQEVDGEHEVGLLLLGACDLVGPAPLGIHEHRQVGAVLDLGLHVREPGAHDLEQRHGAVAFGAARQRPVDEAGADAGADDLDLERRRGGLRFLGP